MTIVEGGEQKLNVVWGSNQELNISCWSNKTDTILNIGKKAEASAMEVPVLVRLFVTLIPY